MKYFYTIKLKSGKEINLWFIGNQLEKILNDYNIPYTKKKKLSERNWWK